MNQTRTLRIPSGVLLGAGILAYAMGTAHAADLTVTAYGGIWEQKLRECYVQPFEKKTGKTVAVVLGSPTQWINQIAASPAHPPIDVLMQNADTVGLTAKRGLIEPFTDEKLPHLKEIGKKFREVGKGYATILNYGAMGLAYNSKAVKNPPKTWKEFVDGTIAGKWTASIPGINYQSTPTVVIWAFAHFFGGGVNNIQPGLDEIKKMKASGHLIFWNDVNEFLSQIKSGDADLGMYWDGRTWAFHDNGNPDIEYLNPKPGAVIQPNLISKVKNGSPLGWKFIDFVLSPEPQACWGNALQYGMSNTQVKFSPKVAPRITKLPEILWPPFDQLASHQGAWVEQWNKTIGN